MPFYSYSCKACGEKFRVFHGMNEEQDYCIACGASDSITRIYDKISLKNNSNKSTSSQRVDQFIKDSKEVLEQQKREASKEYD